MHATPGTQGGTPAPGPRDGGGATGWMGFAAVLLVLNGVLGILLGITGIAKNDVYVATPRYVYRFDLTSWGWIHLVIGVLLVLVGLGVFTGAAWARWTGIFMASLGLVTQFMFIPYFPLWTITLIALDIFVIWALSSNHVPERL
ncbi:hypothetical protein ACIQGZ_02060 [Streptomyces sp. NPDC092296]|uniref:DUF7144 family membrane protein n=1 Tax=Streptomyces sp. NPDC092296 TaxID=3366012 RepID=UPI0038096BBB